MQEQRSVLVLDDEPIVCERLRSALEEHGLRVETFTESSEAVARLEESSFDVIVTDLKMRGPTGMDVLRFIREHAPTTQVIVITGYATIETNHEAQMLGAYQFVPKPFKTRELVKLVTKAIKQA